MYTLEMAMAAALIGTQGLRPEDLGDGARQGIGSLVRLGLALALIVAFCVTMEVASSGAGPSDARQVAIESLDQS